VIVGLIVMGRIWSTCRKNLL